MSLLYENELHENMLDGTTTYFFKAHTKSLLMLVDKNTLVHSR